MTDRVKKQLAIEHLPDCEGEIGRVLWMVEDTRRRTRRVLEGINPAAVDWTATEAGHSIGTLLYHIAAIELDWLYVEVLQKDVPSELAAWFPYDVRDAEGRLTVVRGESQERHWERLNNVRGLLYNAFCSMTPQDFRRPRQLPDYDVTPEWVLHHLMQHEAEHRGEMGILRTRAEKTWV